ncbi:MAG: carbohydrate ABC transporter permease [Acidimicrobiia bacterium]
MATKAPNGLEPGEVNHRRAEDLGPVSEPGLGERLIAHHRLAIIPIRILVAAGVPLIGMLILWWTFTFLRSADGNRLLVVVLALAVGVFGVFLLYWGMDTVNNQLPERWASRIRPYLFVGPAVGILAVFLVWPTVNTILLSFRDDDGEKFVGVANYVYAFTNGQMLTAFRNNLIWLVVGTTFTVGAGLAVAALVDKLSRRTENLAKSLIFLPMAISFVGASVVWRFVYAFRPEGRPQIGLLNAIWTGLGNAPQFWLSIEPWNNLLLVVILVWLQTGFTMVILSAAIKSVPDDLVESARIDGASEWQVFAKVVVPVIKSTMVVVTTTMVIFVLKIFDIVWVTTNGQFGTEVVGSHMIRQAFRLFDDGRGAAVAVVLLLAVIPVMVINVKRFRDEEALR